MYYYRIKDGVVQKVHEEITSSVQVEDFIKTIKQDTETDTGILPRNTITRIEKNGKSLTAIEVQPKVAKVKYRNNGTLHNLELSLPFVQFYIVHNNEAKTIGNIYLSCTKKRISSYNDEIFVVPLLNQYDAGNSYICAGDIKTDMKAPMHERLEKTVNMFFIAEFNNDLTMDFPESFSVKIKGKTYNGLLGWHEQTQKNRLFGLSADAKYYPHKYKTFKERLESIL